MDENVKNKQISDEELENVGGGEMIGVGEYMQNQLVEVNFSDNDIMEKLFEEKKFVTRFCKSCGNKFSAVLEDELHCMQCRIFVR